MEQIKKTLSCIKILVTYINFTCHLGDTCFKKFDCSCNVLVARLKEKYYMSLGVSSQRGDTE